MLAPRGGGRRGASENRCVSGLLVIQSCLQNTRRRVNWTMDNVRIGSNGSLTHGQHDLLLINNRTPSF